MRIPAQIAEGQAQELIRLIPEQHFTQPPPRFTEASLVQVLEDGSFVVVSLRWNNGGAALAGAVTACSATAGCPAVVGASTSRK